MLCGAASVRWDGEIEQRGAAGLFRPSIAHAGISPARDRGGAPAAEGGEREERCCGGGGSLSEVRRSHVSSGSVSGGGGGGVVAPSDGICD